MLRELLRDVLRRVVPEPPEPVPKIDGRKLVRADDMTINHAVPCGSEIIHHLTLMSTSECPRCGRTLAIRSIFYHRTTRRRVPIPSFRWAGWSPTNYCARRAREACIEISLWRVLCVATALDFQPSDVLAVAVCLSAVPPRACVYNGLWPKVSWASQQNPTS